MAVLFILMGLWCFGVGCGVGYMLGRDVEIDRAKQFMNAKNRNAYENSKHLGGSDG